MSASSKKKLRKEQNAAQLTEKQLAEQKEAKKLRTNTIAFVAVITAVLCVALLTMGVTAFINSGILERNTDAVTIGNHTLSNAQLSYYYVETIQKTYSDWSSDYGDYADLLISINEKLDVSLPLDEQSHPSEEGKTYADYFIEKAIEEAKITYALYDAAKAAGYTLSEEDAENIDITVENLGFWGQLYGYSGLKDYLKAVYGNGAQEDTYREFLEVTTLASSFESDHLDGLTYEEADLSAYSEAHFNDFSSFTYNSVVIYADDFMDHSEDEEHTHTAEEEAASLKAAEEAANALAASGAATLEDLNAAIANMDAYKDADKTANHTDNMLYTKISAKIAEWLAESGRNAGELGVIPYTTTTTAEDGTETTNTLGYYVVQFVSRDDNNTKLVNVRHILAEFEGGTTDENGTKVYSDAEKQAAKDKIDKVYADWKAGDATEDSFKALVADNTDDDASSSTGGLYEDVYPGQMVKNFNDWCFDEARQAGDCEIVETEYGYHLIYFVSTDDVTYRNYMIENTMRADDHEAWYNGLVDAVTTAALNTSRLDTDLVLGG